MSLSMFATLAAVAGATGTNQKSMRLALAPAAPFEPKGMSCNFTTCLDATSAANRGRESCCFRCEDILAGLVELWHDPASTAALAELDVHNHIGGLDHHWKTPYLPALLVELARGQQPLISVGDSTRVLFDEELGRWGLRVVSGANSTGCFPSDGSTSNPLEPAPAPRKLVCSRVAVGTLQPEVNVREWLSAAEAAVARAARGHLPEAVLGVRPLGCVCNWFVDSWQKAAPFDAEAALWMRDQRLRAVKTYGYLVGTQFIS